MNETAATLLAKTEEIESREKMIEQSKSQLSEAKAKVSVRQAYSRTRPRLNMR